MMDILFKPNFKGGSYTIWSDLYLYYSCDETSGTTLFNKVTGLSDGTVSNSNMINTISGINNNGLSLRVLGYTANLIYTNHSYFIISFWSKRVSASAYGTIISHRADAVNGAYGIRHKAPGGKLIFYARVGSAWKDLVSNGLTVLNTWTHWVFIYNELGMYIYRNGVYDNYLAVGAPMPSYNDYLKVGLDTIGTPTITDTDIDEIAYWNKNLTLSQISGFVSELYNSGAGKFY